MYKNLFLEGPIQTGKSTLLRKLLKPYMAQIGGFTSQRLLNPEGKTIAFRIGPAAGTPLTAPFSDKYDGIFRITTDEGNHLKYPEVFDNEGIKYLTENHGKKLILLDEIGGVELLNEKFRKTLYEILDGNTPCIGVIKLESKARSMSASVGYDKNSLAEYNKELRHMIKEKYDGSILYFKRNDNKTEEKVKEFLHKIFE